ncbi:MAG: DUF2569 domain-containing protein [Lysobacteraceae bacterium]|nr:MAG: DUF2569 domain-containing protein [Xanthomonadaceae bacterium]
MLIYSFEPRPFMARPSFIRRFTFEARMVTESNQEDLAGIGGWLILVLFGLLASPVRILLYAYEDVWPLYSEGIWVDLTHQSSDFYMPGFAGVAGFSIANNAVLLLVGLLTLYLFLRKSRYAPRVAITWFAIGLVFAVLDIILLRQVPPLAAEVTGLDTFEAVAGPALRAAIWIPYFFVSKRVRATFVR